LMNDSKALEKDGYERSFIYAGAEKQPFAEDGSFRQKWLDGLQQDVDELYERFTNHVADSRQLSQHDVKATEAGMFSAEEAIRLGLVDKILTQESFYGYLADEAQRN